MTTHFHLLVRSPIGELSEGMRRLQLACSRHFNRRRHRAGPLIRARFHSKRVDTEVYRRAVVRHIDASAVAARVVDRAAEHEFRSARAFLVGPRPPWLSSHWIERCVQEHSGPAPLDPKAYLSTFGPRDGEDIESLRDLIEMRMSSAREIDPLDDLIGRTPDQVRVWMIRKARLADGEEIGLPVCGAQAVRRSILAHLESRGEWLVDHGTRTWKGSRLAWPGLLRDLCSMPFAQIAGLCRASVWTATRQVDLHHASIAEDATYAATVAEIAGAALAVTFPDRPPGSDRG